MGASSIDLRRDIIIERITVGEKMAAVASDRFWIEDSASMGVGSLFRISVNPGSGCSQNRRLLSG